MTGHVAAVAVACIEAIDRRPAAGKTIANSER